MQRWRSSAVGQKQALLLGWTLGSFSVDEIYGLLQELEALHSDRRHQR